MNQEHFFDGRLVLAVQEGEHLAVVAMAAEGFDPYDIRVHVVFIPEYGDDFLAAHKSRSQCARGTIAYHQDGVFGIGNVVGQVVFDPAGLHHARCGYDDAGFFE